MKIALAGNPNCGKTTMFNLLTGRNEQVGNWSGVTVSKKEALIKSSLTPDNREDLICVDLPGAYSMSPFTFEESITSAYVTTKNPDVIINVVDATNLSRSLFFTTQLLELGIPVVIALNKSDMSHKQTEINLEQLSAKLHCPIVETVSISTGADNGIAHLIATAVAHAGETPKIPYQQNKINFQDKVAVEQADKQRYAFVNDIVAQVETRKVFTQDYNKQDRFDEIITNKVIGIPIFATVMFCVFYISQTTLGTWLSEWLVGFIEELQSMAEEFFADANPVLSTLLVDGIIGGVGAVVGFLPLIMVMYFLIALLEDCGYMARASVVLDPIFKRVGLSGRSVIPMIIGTGCSIPAIMSCRTIRNDRERKATAMLTSFMPCGAKLPVIALFVGAFFAQEPWVGTLMYFVGIFLIFAGALLIKTITGAKFRRSFFIIELPEYKVPSLRRAIYSMFARAKSYIIKAGTIILVCNAVVHMMQTFTWSFSVVEEGAESTSILASIASPFAFLLIPLGFGVWQLAAAAITGFIAKENVVGTLAVVYGLTKFIDTEELALVGSGNEVAAAMQLTKVAALAYLMFNLFTPPCFAAIGAMNAEMRDRKWLFSGIALQLTTGYIIAFLVYQLGTLMTTGSLGEGFIYGLAFIFCVACVVVYLIQNNRKRADQEINIVNLAG